MRVKYVGSKPLKYDNVTYSRHTWAPGQVVEVPDPVGARLVRHPTVWAAVDAGGDAAVVPPVAKLSVDPADLASVYEVQVLMREGTDQDLLTALEAERARMRPRKGHITRLESALESRANRALGG